MSSEFSVGKDVLSYCGKCKLSLHHTIVAMKDEKTIAKVKCNTCKAEHKFRDPSEAKAKRTTTTKGKRTKKTAAIPIADLWMEALNGSDAKSVPYNIKASFKKGDIIDHPKFGPGVVDELVDNDKIKIIFRHDIKTLIHNRV